MSCLCVTKYESCLGPITLASRDDRLIGLWFDGQKHFGSTLYNFNYEIRDDIPVFKATREWLDCYFSGRIPSFTPDIEFIGTGFQKRVWSQLLRIPYGQTTTYGKISKQIGPGSSSRAVGVAVGRNPVSIIVPCHRVIRCDGKLGGYAGGLERKQYLLLLERGDLFIPHFPEKNT